jgi:hypothetical protein
MPSHRTFLGKGNIQKAGCRSALKPWFNACWTIANDH